MIILRQFIQGKSRRVREFTTSKHKRLKVIVEERRYVALNHYWISYDILSSWLLGVKHFLYVMNVSKTSPWTSCVFCAHTCIMMHILNLFNRIKERMKLYTLQIRLYPPPSKGDWLALIGGWSVHQSSPEWWSKSFCEIPSKRNILLKSLLI